jgi:hypothetical protein
MILEPGVGPFDNSGEVSGKIIIEPFREEVLHIALPGEAARGDPAFVEVPAPTGEGEQEFPPIPLANLSVRTIHRDIEIPRPPGVTLIDRAVGKKIGLAVGQCEGIARPAPTISRHGGPGFMVQMQPQPACDIFSSDDIGFVFRPVHHETKVQFGVQHGRQKGAGIEPPREVHQWPAKRTAHSKQGLF